MFKVDRIDAFSLIVKTLEQGDEKKANDMLRVIIKSSKIDKRLKRNTRRSNLIEIVDDRDARLFQEILIKNISE